MRRKDLKLDKPQALQILKESDYGVLATSYDGFPYAVPLNYVFAENSIYIHSADRGHKISYIKSNNNVSFCVMGNNEVIPQELNTKYRSVVIFGKAEILTEEDEKRMALQELVKKFAPKFVEKGLHFIKKDFTRVAVIKIKIDKITGKGNF